MRAADIASSLFWLAVAAFIAWSGYQLELGSLHDPGSGFVLFWVGLIMAGLSLVVLIRALRRPPAARTALWRGARWPKVVVVLLALFLYAYAFVPLGFLLSTTLLLIFLFKAIEPQSWTVAVLGALASAVAAWAVFQLWLGGQFPAGVLGIG